MKICNILFLIKKNNVLTKRMKYRKIILMNFRVLLLYKKKYLNLSNNINE